MADATHTEMDNLSQDLLGSFSLDNDFTLDRTDLDQSALLVPDENNNPNFTTIEPVTLDQLTSEDPDGAGAFDVIMRSLAAHLRLEYQEGRLTGAEYTKAYIALVQQGLGAALQFVLNKDQAYWQAQGAQKSAQAAEISVRTSRVGHETAREQALTALLVTEQQRAAYAGSVLNLEQIRVGYDIAQKQSDQLTFTNNLMLPAQLDQILAGTAQTSAQTVGITYQNTDILPAQKAQIETGTSQVAAQTVGIEFQNTNILPAQESLVLEQMEAQRAKTLDTRSDGTTAVVGQIGKQKELHSEQITAYIRDPQFKLAKTLLDGWTVQRTTDESLAPPNGLTEANIDAVLNTFQGLVGMPAIPST